MNDIEDQSIQQFLDALASKASTPGGGGAAALMGAQAAALVSMVCHLTLGKANYAAVQDDMQALLQRAESLRAELTAMMQADVTVFNQVMAAYGLAKTTDAEKAVRSAQIQHALRAATDVPLACAKACAEVVHLSRIAAEKGNSNVITDAGVAVMAAYAGLKSAALNVYINAGSIKDREFAEQRLAELAAILAGAEVASSAIYQTVQEKLSAA